MNNKICPLKFNSNTLLTHGETFSEAGYKSCECEGAKCEFWINEMFTTESARVEGGCAIRLKVLTNSEGLIVV